MLNPTQYKYHAYHKYYKYYQSYKYKYHKFIGKKKVWIKFQLSPIEILT